MKVLKIKKADFINWYFFSGSDQEQEDTQLDLGNTIAEQLMDGDVTISPQEFLDQCEDTVIPLGIIQGMEDEDPYTEIGDACDEGLIDEDFVIKLI